MLELIALLAGAYVFTVIVAAYAITAADYFDLLGNRVIDTEEVALGAFFWPILAVCLLVGAYGSARRGVVKAYAWAASRWPF